MGRTAIFKGEPIVQVGIKLPISKVEKEVPEGVKYATYYRNILMNGKIESKGITEEQKEAIKEYNDFFIWVAKNQPAIFKQYEAETKRASILLGKSKIIGGML
jgi:hypothetical protein